MLRATVPARRDEMIADIIPTAQSKLLLDNILTKPYQDLSNAAKVAPLAVRLMLDFEPRRQATRNLEADLVAGHMCIAYSVPQAREYLRAGYSSEPILAEAAAVAMHEFRKH